MNVVFQTVLLVVPSLLVIFAVYLMLQNFLQIETEKNRKLLAIENRKIALPVQLQAYERLALLMERIAPVALVLRISRPGLTVLQLQQEMVSSIHSEFEHNLSQQIYVSADCWTLIKSTVAETIRLVHSTAGQMDPESDAATFSALFIQNVLELNNNQTEQTLTLLRSEASGLF
ncbi:MAG: hypothetical protein HXX14_07190 [Bacteroidetes bacterium]|nr:hypothetical protein [Bacteroidota bacterium]